MNMPDLLIALWLFAGAVTCAWFWEINGEDSYWSREARVLPHIWATNPILAIFLALVVFGGLVGIIAIFMIGWPSVILGVALRRWRVRRQARQGADQRKDDEAV